MVHKITVGVQDERLGKGEQTIPLVGPGNPSAKMQKFLNPKFGGKGGAAIPRAVMDRAIVNEMKRRKRRAVGKSRRRRNLKRSTR